jgi:hypothetical protein
LLKSVLTQNKAKSFLVAVPVVKRVAIDSDDDFVLEEVKVPTFRFCSGILDFSGLTVVFGVVKLKLPHLILFTDGADLLKLFELDFSQIIALLHSFIPYQLTLSPIFMSEYEAAYAVLSSSENLHRGKRFFSLPAESSGWLVVMGHFQSEIP